MHSSHLPVTLSILPFVAQPCTISPFHLCSFFQSSTVFIDLNLSPLLGFLPAISMADFNLFSILLLQGYVLVVAISALTSPEPHLIPGEEEGTVKDREKADFQANLHNYLRTENPTSKLT